MDPQSTVAQLVPQYPLEVIASQPGVARFGSFSWSDPKTAGTTTWPGHTKPTLLPFAFQPLDGVPNWHTP
ncbi:MAG: hypothetical protein JO352_04345 [Chloroflexi bacterium]|nr:hypothetical protein [Chloroflexota bacterium]